MRSLASLALASLLLLTAGAARATTITGADYAGGNLTPSNGDVLSGTFTNVGAFTLPAGTTVFVQANTPLVVYATTIAVYGTLDGTGRGFGGGGGGSAGGAGIDGFAPTGTTGAGQSGSFENGGGGGAGFGEGGIGAKGGKGTVPIGTRSSSGTAYGTSISSPLSPDDAWQGSGGGGGGGNGSLGGGSGGAGGGAVYLEASSSLTITGFMLVDGSTAAAVAEANPGVHPGGGGGGGGGTIVLRALAGLTFRNSARLSAKGGGGGDVDSFGGVAEPGGGGGGGSIRIFAANPSYLQIVISTAGGAAGANGAGSGFTAAIDTVNPPAAGLVGFSTFSVVAQQPTGFAAQGVYVTSISYVWNALTPAQFGDSPNPGVYHLYPSTDTAPFGAPDATSSVAASTITSLTPNTTYFRFVTGYTDWGDGSPSSAVSTHTLANFPGSAAAAFSAMGDVTATFNWTANAPANPSYTSYEINRSTSSSFAAPVSTNFVVGLSSAPAGLLPNTTYYWRVRALNLDGVPSDYAATAATATLATAPSAPAFGTVFVTSASFVWSGGNNPPDTVYEAQVSTDNFFSLAASSRTLMTSATFFSMTPGTQFYFRAYALNRNSVASAFSVAITTRSGNLADLTSPTSPGTPVADRQFSYDGAANFAWAPAQSSVGILDYHLIVGSTPGGNDMFDVTATSNSYAVSNLPSGRSYYARVAGRSNAGVTSPFSGISQGLPVFITTQANPLEKAINWPNPFNPAAGPTQIGFVLSAPADVELRIFTLQGRQVHSQNFSFGAAGNQIVTWDGRNDSGSKVAPGGYIGMVQKHYSDHTDTQKLKIAVLY